MARLASVYVHTFPNKKRYVGITTVKPEKRWANGAGYKAQPKVFEAILEYGWDNIEHSIVANNIPLKEAQQMERKLITEYDSIVNGYNVAKGGGCIKSSGINSRCWDFIKSSNIQQYWNAELKDIRQDEEKASFLNWCYDYICTYCSIFNAGDELKLYKAYALVNLYKSRYPDEGNCRSFQDYIATSITWLENPRLIIENLL